MTSQTKKFIELSDVIGVRFACKKCGCALFLDIHRDNDTMNNLLASANKILSKCPTCASPWASLPDGRLAFDSEIKDFFRRMQQVKEIESKFGCTINLEIKDEEA